MPWGGLRFRKGPSAEPVPKHVSSVMGLWDGTNWVQKTPQLLGTQERVLLVKPSLGGAHPPEDSSRPGAALHATSQRLSATDS